MKAQRNHSNGFIKIILIVIVLLAVLAYWGFDIKKVLSSPEFKEKTDFIWNWIKDLWINYLGPWLNWAWENAGRPILEKIKILAPKLQQNLIVPKT